MLTILTDEINAITAGRLKAERGNLDFFRDEDDDGGRKLTRSEAQVFGIKYNEFPRVITVCEAWFAFLALADSDAFGHSLEAITAAQRAHPELTAGNELHLFVQFASKVGRLAHRQAEAMYWKDWFWTVREEHIHYEGEPAHS